MHVETTTSLFQVMAWHQEETVPSTKVPLPSKFQESKEADLIRIDIFLAGNQHLKNDNIIGKLLTDQGL